MANHRIKRGLDLPLAGSPHQVVDGGPHVGHVGLVAGDYIGMRPSMLVEVGDHVLRGQPLFTDRKTPGVVYTAPACGRVQAIHRGARRALHSLVLACSSDDRQIEFEHWRDRRLEDWDGRSLRSLLVESGLWTALRARPFSRVPSPESTAAALFVTAMDTRPHAPDPAVILSGHEADFEAGLTTLASLVDGPTYLCTETGSSISGGSAPVSAEHFEGPHPSGNPGTHIHFLMPAHRERTVWHIGMQDVIAVGHLVRTGELSVRRVVSIAGPAVTRPRLVETRLGASIDELLVDGLVEGETRIISGDVLSGRTSMGDVHGYLGRYDQQISAIAEDREREFLGWLGPGLDRFSTVRMFASSIFGRGRTFDLTTSTRGSKRAMVPIGMYERVMPLDIIPTFLLRSIVVGDLEWAEQLGCLELDEEDLALCTFVCPGKMDYGPMLRSTLERIEKEG